MIYMQYDNMCEYVYRKYLLDGVFLLFIFAFNK